MNDQPLRAGADTFERVAHALRERWVAQQAMPTTTPSGIAAPDARSWDDHSTQTRNLLLDACGSDHRALVDLLLTVGDTVRSALHDAVLHDSALHDGERASSARGASAGWDARRAPVVHRLVATRFLQPDIARWLVDSWAYAIGAREQSPESPAMQFVDARDAVGAQPASHGGAHGPARGHAQATAHSSAQSGAAASAGMRAATMMATTGPWRRGVPAASTSVSGAAVRTVGRGHMTPAELARIKRIERVSLATLAGTLVFGFVAHGYALWSRPLERQRVVPIATAAAPNAALVSAAANAQSSTMLASAGRPTRDEATALAVAPRDTSVPPTAAPLARAWIGPVAGRYFVTHRKVSVAGGEGCDDVASALAWQQPSIETIEADSGGSAIRLMSRGVRGTLEPDGRFSTGPDSGNTDGVRWTFSMYGRFTADGFTASSRKTTEAIIAWHKSRSCSVVAELTGHRLAR